MKTKRWDAAEHLKTDEDIIEYINAALEDGDIQVIAAARGDVARAKGMTKVARDAGLARPALYRALCDDGNPAFDTVLRVTKAMGVKLVVEREESVSG